MAQLPDDALSALWSLFDRTGIRPEWVIPVLWSESGLNPAATNAAGLPYYGVAQDFGPYLAKKGIDPATYITWPASEQIATVLTPRLEALVSYYGPIRSATRLYQSNFLPATLRTAPSLFLPVTVKGDPYYAANAGLDWRHAGEVLVSDLAWWMGRAAASHDVQASIVRAYQLRPSAAPAHETVYGDDFALDPWATLVLVAAAALLSTQ